MAMLHRLADALKANLTSFGFLSEPDGIAIAPVPEPGTFVFSPTGLIMMGAAYLRRRRRGAAA